MKRILYISLILLICSCTHRSRLDGALDLAGTNRFELERVLNHYQDSGLKLDAACFLIENMPGKYGVVAQNNNDGYKNFLRNIPKEDSVSWRTDSSVVALMLDSLSRRVIPQKHRVEDLKSVRADFLIRHIDMAFKVWQESKYAKYYSYDDFCHYILPYRMGQEPLSDWMMTGYERYGHLLDSALSPKDIAIRIALDEGMRYNIGMGKYPYPQSFEEMMHSRWGTCEEMALYLTLALRSVGIPSSIDFVPAWANRSAGHCWNVLKDTCGRFIEVGYGEEGINSVVYKISKIYRKEYVRGKDADVTSEYAMPQSDLIFHLTKDVGNVPVSLCTFNNRDWTPVAFAMAEGRKVTFPSVGRGALWGENKILEYQDEGKGLVYLPMTTDGREPLANPVILFEDGTQRTLSADNERTERVVLYRKYPFYVTNTSDVYDSNNVCQGDSYELFYWDNEWIGMGRRTAEADSLVYENVPMGALLWLHNYTRGKEERIFTYEDGQQIWW